MMICPQSAIATAKVACLFKMLERNFPDSVGLILIFWEDFEIDVGDDGDSNGDEEFTSHGTNVEAPPVLELSVISGSWSESCAAFKAVFTAACC